MGPIGDSAVQSIGPVRKVMADTKKIFTSIKQSIVKIVSSTKKLFSPTGKLINSSINVICVIQREEIVLIYFPSLIHDN